MKEQFCTYEIALQLKEFEFDEPCFGFYVSNVVGHAFTLIQNGIGYKTNSELTGKTHISAPLWQQVIDWFDNKNIIIGIDINPGTLFYRVHLYKRYYHNPGRLVIGEYFLSGEFNNFISKEEAREQAILKAIELCKEKKN